MTIRFFIALARVHEALSPQSKCVKNVAAAEVTRLSGAIPFLQPRYLGCYTRLYSHG
jgi:hypothetical protein